MFQSCHNTDGFTYFESYINYIGTFHKRLLSIKTNMPMIYLYTKHWCHLQKGRTQIEILLIYNKNNRGPSTASWGTPQTTGFFFISLPFSRPWIQFVLFGIILLDISRTIWQWHHVIHDDIIYTAKHCGQHLSKA